VHLESGKVYAQRIGNDEYVGRVDLGNGKVWRDVIQKRCPYAVGNYENS